MILKIDSYRYTGNVPSVLSLKKQKQYKKQKIFWLFKLYMLIIASLSLAANVSDNSLWSLGGTKKNQNVGLRGTSWT